MSHFIGTKTLQYEDHKDELIFLGECIRLLAEYKYTDLAKLMIERQDSLLLSQKPVLVDYDPTQALREAQR